MRSIVTNMWVLLASLFLALGWRELLSADMAYVLPWFLLVGYFLVLGVLTSRGFFTDHCGGWPTYIGLLVAFFAVFFVGCALADVFWGTPPPSSVWFLVSLTSVLAVWPLVVGAKRHRLAVILSHAERVQPCAPAEG